jgi:hypothetical protein
MSRVFVAPGFTRIHVRVADFQLDLSRCFLFNTKHLKARDNQSSFSLPCRSEVFFSYPMYALIREKKVKDELHNYRPMGN